MLSTATQPLGFTWTGGTWAVAASRSYGGNGNTTAAPAFVNAYFNTDRRNAYVVGETTARRR